MKIKIIIFSVYASLFALGVAPAHSAAPKSIAPAAQAVPKPHATHQAKKTVTVPKKDEAGGGEALVQLNYRFAKNAKPALVGDKKSGVIARYSGPSNNEYQSKTKKQGSGSIRLEPVGSSLKKN